MSCATVISEDILFLGSWLGDSLLAKFTRHQVMDQDEGAEQSGMQSTDDADVEPLNSDAFDEDQVRVHHVLIDFIHSLNF